MKTYTIATFLATLVVLLVGTGSLEVSASLLFLFGFVCILSAEYGDGPRQLIRSAPAGCSQETLSAAPVHEFKLAA